MTRTRRRWGHLLALLFLWLVPVACFVSTVAFAEGPDVAGSASAASAPSAINVTTPSAVNVPPPVARAGSASAATMASA
ncbi:MAG TPA: hypothetical protein VH044_18915, partial [Polyangiaceae bacterium]|nr:hypothetical protein [Polyangiaceae bacterium]